MECGDIKVVGSDVVLVKRPEACSGKGYKYRENWFEKFVEINVGGTLEKNDGKCYNIKAIRTLVLCRPGASVRSRL